MRVRKDLKRANSAAISPAASRSTSSGTTAPTASGSTADIPYANTGLAPESAVLRRKHGDGRWLLVTNRHIRDPSGPRSQRA